MVTFQRLLGNQFTTMKIHKTAEKTEQKKKKRKHAFLTQTRSQYTHIVGEKFLYKNTLDNREVMAKVEYIHLVTPNKWMGIGNDHW